MKYVTMLKEHFAVPNLMMTLTSPWSGLGSGMFLMTSMGGLPHLVYPTFRYNLVMHLLYH